VLQPTSNVALAATSNVVMFFFIFSLSIRR
jgi:hypothetical protein